MLKTIQTTTTTPEKRKPYKVSNNDTYSMMFKMHVCLKRLVMQLMYVDLNVVYNQ